METQKWIFFFKNANLCVSAVMFCKQVLAYTVHIVRSPFLCNKNIQVGLNIYLC